MDLSDREHGAGRFRCVWALGYVREAQENWDWVGYLNVNTCSVGNGAKVTVHSLLMSVIRATTDLIVTTHVKERSHDCLVDCSGRSNLRRLCSSESEGAVRRVHIRG